MLPAAVGFRVHSGWVALVAIALEEGFPRVLLRERPHLVETFTYEFRQPYHTAEKKPLEEGRDFIARVRAEASGLASMALHAARAKLQEQGYQLERSGLLLASGRPLPALAQILASHALIHTADGELFREALLHACKKDGLETLTMRESELLEHAGRTLRLPAPEVLTRLTELGRAKGSPWAQDEKFAALIAWLSLL